MRTKAAATVRLLKVLHDTRALLSRPENCFDWSGGENAAEALSEIDGLIAQAAGGVMPDKAAMTILYAPTGPVQEVSLSSGWGDEYLRVADRFDAIVV